MRWFYLCLVRISPILPSIKDNLCEKHQPLFCVMKVAHIAIITYFYWMEINEICCFCFWDCEPKMNWCRNRRKCKDIIEFFHVVNTLMPLCQFCEIVQNWTGTQETRRVALTWFPTGCGVTCRTWGRERACSLTWFPAGCGVTCRTWGREPACSLTWFPTGCGGTCKTWGREIVCSLTWFPTGCGGTCKTWGREIVCSLTWFPTGCGGTCRT